MLNLILSLGLKPFLFVAYFKTSYHLSLPRWLLISQLTVINDQYEFFQSTFITNFKSFKMLKSKVLTTP